MVDAVAGRAIDSKSRLRALTRIADIPARALRLLRDVYEHWDQLRRQVAGDAASISGAAQKLALDYVCRHCLVRITLKLKETVTIPHAKLIRSMGRLGSAQDSRSEP